MPSELISNFLKVPNVYLGIAIDGAAGVDDDAILHGMALVPTIAYNALVARDRGTFMDSISKLQKAGVLGAGRASSPVTNKALEHVGRIMNTCIESGTGSREDLFLCVTQAEDVLKAVIAREAVASLRSAHLMSDYVGSFLGATDALGLSAALRRSLIKAERAEDPFAGNYLDLLKHAQRLYREIGEAAAAVDSQIALLVCFDVLEAVRQAGSLLRSEPWARYKDILVGEMRWLKAVWVFIPLRSRRLEWIVWHNCSDGLLYAAMLFIAARRADAALEACKGMLSVATSVAERSDRPGPASGIAAALETLPIVIALSLEGYEADKTAATDALVRAVASFASSATEEERQLDRWMHLIEEQTDSSDGMLLDPWEMIYSDYRRREGFSAAFTQVVQDLRRAFES